MGLFSLLGKGLKTLFTPQTFKTGEQFEHYVRKRLFKDRHFELLQRTLGYNVKTKDYVQSANPDFKLRDRRTKKIFFAEAKYRKSFFKGHLTWCSENQLRHYRQCNHEFPVFIILGVGGEPSHPDFVALIPLSQANFTDMFLSHAKKFSIHPRNAISSKTLWRR